MIRIDVARWAPSSGDVRKNFTHIEKEVTTARKRHAHILIIPAASLTGVLLGSRWEQSSFVQEVQSFQERLLTLSQDIVLIWGGITTEKTSGEENLSPTIYVAQEGKLLCPNNSEHPYAVTELPCGERAFSSQKDFIYTKKVEPSERPHSFTITCERGPLTVGILSCDEIDDTLPQKARYLSSRGAEILINLSPSRFVKNEATHISTALTKITQDNGCPLLNVRRLGIENNGKNVYVYDGMTTAYTEKGAAGSSTAFEESVVTYYYAPRRRVLTPAKPLPIEEIPLLTAMRYGVRGFLDTIGMKKVIIALSGGIDSAVNAALYRTVLPPEQVLLVNMPSRFTSNTTKGLAKELAANLGCPFLTVPIDAGVDHTVATLDGISFTVGSQKTTLYITDFIKENIQARERSGRILSALASMFGGIFTCNANKTELTVGYGTLYGDIAGAFAATADLWKHDMYALGHALNTWYGKPVIPEGIFTIKPSAELSAAQAVDEGKGDPLIYEYHDYLFASFMEHTPPLTPEELLKAYIDGTLGERLGTTVSIQNLFPDTPSFIMDLERWYGLFTGLSVAKRIQGPPLLAVTHRPYGPLFEESQGKMAYTTSYEKLKAKVTPP